MHQPLPESTLFPYTTLFRSLTQLREIVVPRSTDPFVIQRAKGMARVLKHLQQVDRYGDEAASAELADLRDLLRSEEHTSELQSRRDLVCRLLLATKNTNCIY